MNLKKITGAVLLVAVLCAVCVFTGCSKKDQAARDGSARIKVSHWDVTVTSYIEALVEAFRQAHPDIAVEVIDIPSTDYTQKLQIMLNGGSDVDVFWIKDGDTTKGLVNRGQLADLSAYINRDNISLPDFNGLAERFIMEGKTVALPASTGYYILYYNKDIFDRNGIPYPSNDMTWNEWEQLAGRLTSGSGNNKVYGALFHTWQACVQNWALQDGVHTIMATDYSFFRPYYEMALRMQKAGSLWDYGALRSGGIHYTSAFLQGNIAMVPMGTWFYSTIIDRVKNNETNVRWGIATLPHAANVQAGWTVGSVTPIAINQASRYKEAAWEFVKFITGEEGARIYASYGQSPGRANADTLEAVASMDGMPEGALDALIVKNISLDRPMVDMVAEVNQMLGQEHSLIMLEEVTVDKGLEKMGKRSAEIQNGR